MVEITRVQKSDGALTKRLYIDDEGQFKADGSACLMQRGTAHRATVEGAPELAELIERLGPNEALLLGRLRSDLADAAPIVTKSARAKMNGSAPANIVTRTSDYFAYRPKSAAFVLIDFDTKGMSSGVADALADAGGVWDALCQVVPDIANAERVIRTSTSSGLSRTDTGDVISGSGGLHIYVQIADGSDAERFLKTLHDRCWLAGFGWMMLGAGGQLLDRSIVDRMVGAPERLVFEGAPIVEAPLAQDRDARQPKAIKGDALATATGCPPLTIAEASILQSVKAKEAQRLSAESGQARSAYVKARAKVLADVRGIGQSDAERAISKLCDGVLLPHVILPFDDIELTGKTVADVLADPLRFAGETLADPVEGVEYGTCKAKVMLRADGTPWINSFAHGRTTYELKFDAASVADAVGKADAASAMETFVKMVLRSDMTEDEIERVKSTVIARTGTGKRIVDKALKSAIDQQQKGERAERKQRQTAERDDPRPQIEAPRLDAPWLPNMALLNEVLGSSKKAEPPMRDVDGYIIGVRSRPAIAMHALTSDTANEKEGEVETSILPAPDQPLLTRFDDGQVAELIERHIDFTETIRVGKEIETVSVHLNMQFVKHFVKRDDKGLPIASSIVTLPMVMADGSLLTGAGLDRKRGIVFRVPDQLADVLPSREQCGTTAVAEAMSFLCDEWLADVTTDYAGKCTLISCAMSIIERAIFKARPAYFITAGKRGSGKTTACSMVTMAATGQHASAAAWSPDREERRKSLMSHLGDGVPYIGWDNIMRGTAISCPTIEAVLTAESWTDRILGTPDKRTVPAAAIHIFTGNNIAAKGDMASRSLTVRLTTDRPDPENRKFHRHDPVEWTRVHRGQILCALYTIMLGNPRLLESRTEESTRFKDWWRIVGSAVENAALQHRKHVDALVIDRGRVPPSEISFRDAFLDAEEEDEENSGLSLVIETIRSKWPNGVSSRDLTAFTGDATLESVAFKCAIEQASGKSIQVISPTILTWRLKAVVDAPVNVNGAALVLRYVADHEGGKFMVKGAGA